MIETMRKKNIAIWGEIELHTISQKEISSITGTNGKQQQQHL